MASWQAEHRTSAPERHRRLVPVGAIVLAYVVVGMIWVLGGETLADGVAASMSVARWVVHAATGLLFVLVTALALLVVMTRRADQLDAADACKRVETRRLVASEERNRLQAAALSGTANAVVITDRAGTIEWVNAAFETMTGYPSAVAVGATTRLVRSGVQDEAFYRELWDTILAGKVWRGQVVNRSSDGELYTVSQIITPVVAEGGGVQHFVAIQEDITEQIRATRELEASRLQLQSLFDNAIDAIMLADDQSRYLEVNPAVCELTGYSRDELLGMRPADLAAPAQQPADVDTRFNEFLQAGTEAGTFALRHKDGHVVETEYRAVSNIRPGVHLSVLRDVTERNRMMRALTVAEGQFRQLAENAADIVTKLRIDEAGRLQIDYINPSATTILGYPSERFYDDPDLLLIDLFHPRGPDLDDALDLLPTPAEPNRLATIQVQAADGHPVWLEVHSTLTDLSTTPVTIQLVARDVTARLEMTQALEQALSHQLESAEQLRALNAMKDTFLQSVSHELRTPLTSIMGFSKLLADPRQGLSAEHTREFHRRIVKNAERLQRLLDDLLDVDRFTRGQIEANRRPIDLTELIRRMADDIDLGGHPVELDLEPITMNLDAPWVERIVANLLRNIVRHTPDDTRISILTRATPEGVELTVDDAGPGIPEVDRQRVIEPFQQGTHSASAPQPGTGVGLALANAFARIHGGGLAITESPTGGTRATVTLAHARTATAGSPAFGDGSASDAAGPPVGSRLDVPQPEPADATAEAERITNEGLRRLLKARTADEVRGIVLSVVHRLGGWTVPARLADSSAIPVDLSFGIDDPLVPTAEPDGTARALLERHLPRLVEEARRTLENLARIDELAHDASIDPLTGLLDRRAYERVLPRLSPGDSVVLFDLDGFKPVNDIRGHEAGDQVLRSFGATLRNFTRATDHPCRIGGDEFALLLDATSKAQAHNLIAGLRTDWEEQRPWPVSFSVGMANVTEDPAAAVAAADLAMYDDKRSKQGPGPGEAVSKAEEPS